MGGGLGATSLYNQEMNIEDFKNHLDQLKNNSELKYTIGDSVSITTIENIEQKLKVIFPKQVKVFYSNYNGLLTKNPSLELYKIEELELIEKLIIFGKFNNIYEVAFDTNTLNSANQWNIINVKNKYCITLTMASFWSNKIPVWLKSKREIWDAEIY